MTQTTVSVDWNLLVGLWRD